MAPSTVPTDFRRRKLAVTLWIMGMGMAMALAWAAVQGWGLGHGYPYNSFLFNPRFRFTDLANTIVISKFSNPYLDPSAVYPPFAWLMLRWLSVLPDSVDLALVFFTSLTVLLLLLDTVLQPLIPRLLPRLLACFFLAGTSYPVVVSFDRGNIEIVLTALIGSAIFFLSRARYVPAMLCLVPAIGLKLYPACLLVLFLRQRRITVLLGGLVATVAITFLSLHLLSLPIQSTWQLYRQDVAAYTDSNVYENGTLQASASPWNAFKLLVMGAGHVGLIEPVAFDHHNPFIRTTYAIYAAGSLLLAAMLAAFACLWEKDFLRCAAVLLLLVAMGAPAGGDYRLLHAGIALICIIALKTRRAHDLLVVVLLALIMVPKKEVILSSAGLSESGYADVSLTVLIDPLLIMAALFILLYDSSRQLDPGWNRLRARGLLRVLRVRPST